MELKLVKVGGVEYAVYTFNRTAYGIEILLPISTFSSKNRLLIAPLMELKSRY